MRTSARCKACALFLLSLPAAGSAFAGQAPPQPQIAHPQTLDDAGCAVLLHQGEQAIRREDFPAATQAATRAAASCSDQTNALLLLARAEMLGKQFDPAIETLGRLLAAHPDNVTALTLLGETQYLDNHDRDAAAAFQKAIAAAPDESAPHYFLGRMEYADGRIPQAVKQFETAIQLDGKFYKAYDNLGLCYEALGNDQLALENYTKALELVRLDHPEYDGVYFNLAAFMLKQGKDQQAFDLAAEAAQRNPREPRNFMIAGKALLASGHDDAAVRWLTRAAAMDPSYADPHLLLARAYRRLGRDAMAASESAAFAKLAARVPAVRR